MSSHGEGAAPRLFEVERFEHVGPCEERILLRVDGRYVEQPGRRVLDATLFVDDGLAIRRHAPVPDPSRLADTDSWLWRAAFDVPALIWTLEPKLTPPSVEVAAQNCASSLGTPLVSPMEDSGKQASEEESS